mmetsp:Transcript_71130/g.217991  ORF Transcript_71130/g.217991 Transcript_71130/m.217991 type:complete len:222 (-) Transcript_71130:1257-1922(-)
MREARGPLPGPAATLRRLPRLGQEAPGAGARAERRAGAEEYGGRDPGLQRRACALGPIRALELRRFPAYHAEIRSVLGHQRVRSLRGGAPHRAFLQRAFRRHLGPPGARLDAVECGAECFGSQRWRRVEAAGIVCAAKLQVLGSARAGRVVEDAHHETLALPHLRFFGAGPGEIVGTFRAPRLGLRRAGGPVQHERVCGNLGRVAVAELRVFRQQGRQVVH